MVRSYFKQHNFFPVSNLKSIYFALSHGYGYFYSKANQSLKLFHIGLVWLSFFFKNQDITVKGNLDFSKQFQVMVSKVKNDRDMAIKMVNAFPLDPLEEITSSYLASRQ